MKCIFAATAYQFAVQYHASASVAAQAQTPWEISIDGLLLTYRMVDCRNAMGEPDLACAVFVPSTLGRREAGQLLADLNAAQPGLIPPHLTFQFDRLRWWMRARSSPPFRANYYQG